MKTQPAPAVQSGLAALFVDRQAAAARPPDVTPFNTWNVRGGRAPAEGA